MSKSGLNDSYSVIKELSEEYEKQFKEKVPTLVNENKFKVKNFTKKTTKLGGGFQSSMDLHFEKALEETSAEERAKIIENKAAIVAKFLAAVPVNPVIDGRVMQNARRFAFSATSLFKPSTEENYYAGLLDRFILKPLGKAIEGALRLVYMPVAYFRDSGKVVQNELPQSVDLSKRITIEEAQKDKFITPDVVRLKFPPAQLFAHFVKNVAMTFGNGKELKDAPAVLDLTPVKRIEKAATEKSRELSGSSVATALAPDTPAKSHGSTVTSRGASNVAALEAEPPVTRGMGTNN